MLKSIRIPKGHLHFTKNATSRLRVKRFQVKEMVLTENSEEDNHLKKMLKCCRYSQAIKKLYIEHINSKMFALVHERIKGLVSLQFVNIYIGRFHGITEAALERLSQGLKELNQLRKIIINCHHWKIGDNGIKSIGNALKRLGSLEEMSTDFQECERISDFGVKKFSQGLKECKGLKRLKLSLSGGEEITNKGLDSLSEAISRMIYLESVEIIFRINGENPDFRLRNLSLSLGKFEDLKNLRLCFSGFQSIEDEDMSYLKEGLKKLKRIRHINLQFGWCEKKITDIGFKEMCEGLAAFGSLKSLRLEFMTCKDITDEGLRALGLVLRRMDLLEDVYLNLTNCVEITEVGFNEIKEGLSLLKNLTSVYFISQGCWKLRESLAEEYEKELTGRSGIKDICIAL